MKFEDMTIARLREAYRDAVRGLTYEAADEQEVKAAVHAKLAGIAHPSPADYVLAVRSLRFKCGRCAGTGRFVTYVENGVPKGPGGSCFRCQGRGTQGFEDGHRNRTRDNHISAA